VEKIRAENNPLINDVDFLETEFCVKLLIRYTNLVAKGKTFNHSCKKKVNNMCYRMRRERLLSLKRKEKHAKINKI